MDQGFPTSEKLKSKKLLDKLFSEGKSVSQYPVKLIFLKIENQEFEGLNVGVSVPKRNFKHAVDRNHLKRLLRECYRKNKYLVLNNMNCSYAFMFIYVSKEPLVYSQLFEVMQKLMKKFVDKEKKPTS